MSSLRRRLAGEALHVQLAKEAEQLEASDILRATGHSARTLVKEGPLRITLIVLAPGGHIAAHRTEAPVSIQALQGALRLRVGQRATLVELAAGELLMLGPGVEHDLSSETGGMVLLTVVRPEPDGVSLAEPSTTAAASESTVKPGSANAPQTAGPTDRMTITARDSAGLTYSCRGGEIWVHYPARGSTVPGSNDPGWPIGPIPAFYATHPPNAITAERVRLWRSLCVHR